MSWPKEVTPVIGFMRVKARTIYTCACGATAMGSTVSWELHDNIPISGVEHALKRFTIPNGHMPVGWYSDADGIHCSDCLEKKERG